MKWIIKYPQNHNLIDVYYTGIDMACSIQIVDSKSFLLTTEDTNKPVVDGAEVISGD